MGQGDAGQSCEDKEELHLGGLLGLEDLMDGVEAARLLYSLASYRWIDAGLGRLCAQRTNCVFFLLAMKTCLPTYCLPVY